ncbi:hypothetical protein ASG61_20815 [Bacillus sp. Leaf75]|nr:hypothetical protein ASG61_20815 [Bacillus sp. Leaf75]
MATSPVQKRLLLIGGRTDIYEKAKKLDFHITLIQEKEWMEQHDYNLVDRVVHAPIDATYIVDIAYILHQNEPFEAVVSFLEAGLLNAAIIKDKLNILGNPLEPVELTKYKHKMRKQMLLKNVPSIPYALINKVEEVPFFAEEVGYPIILKSTKGSGSRKIYKLDGPVGIQDAFNGIKSQYPDGEVIAEKFILGKEISVEAFSWEGKHTIIGLTDKLTTGAPFFVEIGHSIPSNLSPEITTKVKSLTTNFLSAIGHQHGPSHTEIIIQHDEPYIIESHTRTGGDLIYELVANVYDFDFFEETFKRIASNNIGVETKSHTEKASAIRHFVIPEGKVKAINGVEEAMKLPNIQHCHLDLKVGQLVKKFTHSDERYGYVVATGENVVQVLRDIETAMKKIEIEIV